MKERIVIFVDYYLPGFKAGGPVRSISALIDALKDQYDFTVITRNHDFLSDVTYDRPVNQPTEQAGATVYYLSRPYQTSRHYFRLLKHIKPHKVYLNSFFSLRFSTLPLIVARCLGLPVLLAPRGELLSGALVIKPIRKQIFIFFFRFLFLLRLIKNRRAFAFHATSHAEAEAIRLHFRKIPIKRVNNLFTSDQLAVDRQSAKKEGEIKAVFLSRITRKKNLDGLLRLLRFCPVLLQFDIYGPQESALYWRVCQAFITSLPAVVKVFYKGIVPPEEVGKTLAQYDVMLFLTHGENFGHVILESLAAGCPVILSRTTPWQDLEEKHAGWIIDAEDEVALNKILKNIAGMDKVAHQVWVEGAQNYAREILVHSDLIEKEKILFE